LNFSSYYKYLKSAILFFYFVNVISGGSIKNDFTYRQNESMKNSYHYHFDVVDKPYYVSRTVHNLNRSKRQVTLPLKLNLQKSGKSKQSPYVKAAIGNVTGMIMGGLFGGIMSTGIFGNPDDGLYNVGLFITGMYSGGIIGAATGTTIALRTGIKSRDCFKIFLYSLAPHLVHAGLVVNNLKNNKSIDEPAIVYSIGFSIPLSVILPIWEYKKLILRNK